MNFTYNEWENFCKELKRNDIISVTAASLLESARNAELLPRRFVVIKHDVESFPQKALDIARIESRYGHRSSYYVQPSLMVEANVGLFNEIQRLGHEVSYHHSVIDSAQGDIALAIVLYQKDVELFEKYGFDVKTVCQHGNPASKYDNRDFFKSCEAKEKFPDQIDIMVDFSDKIGCAYTYISDVGMLFKIVKDPVHHMNLSADDEYTIIGDIDHVLNTIFENPSASYVVSVHPHRYSRSAVGAIARKMLFNLLKSIARVVFLIPGIRKLVFRNNRLIRYI